MNRDLLIQTLKTYDGAGDEQLFKVRFLELLAHPQAYHRNHLPGHITGSAWIIDRSQKYVLLTHHAKLNKWLQPGGHADGDENVLNVSLREAEEETGLKDVKLLHESVFDLDIHPIPARKEFPDHLHYDIRFLFEADKKQPLLISEESHALRWVALEQLDELTGGNASILRMADKLRVKS